MTAAQPSPGQEPVIDPTIPICDAHHHLWDRPGQRYLLPELLDDLHSGHNVLSTVFVEWRSHYREAGPVALRPVGETAFASQVANEAFASGGPAACKAIVGYADLGAGACVDAVLSAHMEAGGGRFKGIRCVATWDSDLEVVGGQQICEPGLYRSAQFREGFAVLRDYRLTFDAWVFYPQMDDLIDLAKAFPYQPIVLNHAGGVLGVGRYAGRRDEQFAIWHKAVHDLAECPNVSIKLGGLGMKRSGFDSYGAPQLARSIDLAQAWRPWIEACIEEFGASRCMFESNFPVDGATCSYRVLWNTFKRIAMTASPSDKAALLHDTAARFYAIAERPAHL